MNKKAQNGIIGAFILLGIFIINWFIWLGTWINTVGEMAIVNNKLTGIEAFFYSNLNFMIFIIMCLGMLAWTIFGGE